MHVKGLAHNKSSIKDSCEHDLKGLLLKAIHIIGVETEAERFGNNSAKVTQLIPSRAQRAQVSTLPDLLINACKAW